MLRTWVVFVLIALVCLVNASSLPLSRVPSVTSTASQLAKRSRRDLTEGIAQEPTCYSTADSPFIAFGVNVTIGNSNMLLFLDTGSPDMLIPSANCNDTNFYYDEQGDYMPSMPCSNLFYQPSNNAVNLGIAESGAFGDGYDTYSGGAWSDTVTVASLSPLQMKFTVYNVTANGFGNYCPGIIGFSGTFPDDNVDNYVPLSIKEGVMKPGVFALAQCANLYTNPDVEGELFLGEDGSSVATGPIIFTPLLANWWYTINLLDVAVGGVSLGIQPKDIGATIIDSGTSQLGLVGPIYDAIVKILIQNPIGVHVANASTPCYELPYTPDEINALVPAITFTFQGVKLTVPAVPALVTPFVNGTYCTGFFNAGSIGFNIIGMTVQTNVLTVYDIDHLQIGFASTNFCSANQSAGVVVEPYFDAAYANCSFLPLMDIFDTSCSSLFTSSSKKCSLACRNALTNFFYGNKNATQAQQCLEVLNSVNSVTYFLYDYFGDDYTSLEELLYPFIWCGIPLPVPSTCDNVPVLASLLAHDQAAACTGVVNSTEVYTCSLACEAANNVLNSIDINYPSCFDDIINYWNETYAPDNWMLSPPQICNETATPPTLFSNPIYTGPALANVVIQPAVAPTSFVKNCITFNAKDVPGVGVLINDTAGNSYCCGSRGPLLPDPVNENALACITGCTNNNVIRSGLLYDGTYCYYNCQLSE